MQFRLDTIPASVRASAMLCVPAFLYAALAARPGSRVALCAMIALALAGALAALRLPWERLMRSRFREAYVIAWWLADFLAVIGATVLDGGPHSPLLLLVFVLLLFMGFSYPRFNVVVLGGTALIGYAALAFAYAEEPARALFIASALAATGTMSYWQTQNLGRQQKALVAGRDELQMALRQSEATRQALQDSERRMSEAAAIAHIGSWEWERASDRLTVSAELLRIMGLRLEDFDSTLDGYLARVHPTDREEVASRMRSSTKDGKAFSYEHRIVRPDGAVRLLLIHGDAIVDDRGPARSRGICQDLTELRAVEARAQHLAEHDALTGLFNRRRLADEVDRELHRGPREDRAGALLMLDVDGFGFYNDAHGQPAGDALLRAMAAALRGRLRTADTVARCGGDEFAAILPEASDRDAIAIADELRALLAACAPASPVTLSVGIAMFGQTFEQVGDDVLAAADIALHEAKDKGGNRTVVYGGQGGADMSWVRRIQAALDEDRFVLYGQPVVDLQTHTESHRELLIRMLADDGTLVCPGVFLPTAERYGLINAIDRWVLAAAIELAAAGERVAVNLSGRSIGDQEILQSVRQAIADGLDPANLIFEITETATVTNLADAREFAGELTGLGCDLAIDDFGTGFSSLTYLKYIPARYVKIDMEFVKDLTSSETDQQVVASVVGVARSLGKQTVAEGVEDEPTLAVVRDLGVDFVQGFHTGRPQRMSKPKRSRHQASAPGAAAAHALTR